MESKKISEYLVGKLETGKYQRNYELAIELGIKSAMLSKYLNKEVLTPNLELARNIYKKEGVVIYPYSEEAVNEG